MLWPQHTNGMVNRKDGEKKLHFVSGTDNNKNTEVADKSITCINAHDSPHVQVISALSWNCHSKWLHRQQKILGWNLITQLRMQTNFNPKGSRTSENKDFMMSECSTLHDEHPCNKPWKHTSRLCLGNEVIWTTEKFSTLRVWWPIHKSYWKPHMFGGIL